MKIGFSAPVRFKRSCLRPFIALVISLLIGLQATAISQTSAQSNPTNTILRMTLVVPPNSLNELTTVSATSGYQIGDLEYTGLYPTVLPNGTLDWSQSATDWVSHNSNYTQWMFNVRPGLKWSDGTDVTANDILATFGPKFAFNSSYDIWGIGPEVANEYALNSSTAVYDLNVTDAHLIDKMNIQTFLPLYPASFVNQKGASSVDFGTDVGLGPFYVSNYTAGQFQMVMLRNPYFYTTGMPEPKISRIDINFVDSLSLTSTNLLSGSTDFAPVELSNVGSILKDPNLGVIDQKGWDLTNLEYNDSMYPYNMTAFRQALAYSINQTQFIRLADSGYALPAYNAEGLEVPYSTVWYNPNIQKYRFNQSQALSLLSNIGINKGFDNLLHYPNNTVVTLTIWTDTDNTADTVGASIVQQDLKQLGFNVNVQTTSSSNLVADYSNGIDGIRNSMILFTALAFTPQLPFIESFPAWDTIWLPTTPNPYWIYPPSANVLYQNNYTAFISTDNYTQDYQYFSNIQALNAKYLPTLVLAYPDVIYAYNKQSWTGWPTSSYMDFHAGPWNFNAFANLTPAGASTTSTPSTTMSSTASSQSLISQSTTSTAPSSSANLTGIAIAVVIIIVVAGVLFALRRRH